MNGSASTPNDSLSPQILDVARKMIPLVREHAGQAESERQLPAPMAKAFAEAGIFRMCLPRELGGFEANPLTVSTVVEELSQADGSIGWVSMIIGAGTFMVGSVSKEGGREMFADPKTAVCGSFAPTGRAVEAEGGFRISGRWSFMSGVGVSQYVGGTAVVFDGDKPRMTPFGPEVVVGLWPVPKGRIVDTWHVAGLRGTGSHDYEANDVFVPNARCIRMPPSASPYEGQLYRFPLFGFLSLSIASSALGIARCALDEVSRMAATKTPFGMMSSLATRASAQIGLAEAEGALRSGRALLRDTASEIWQKLGAKAPVSPQDRAHLRLAATTATLSAARAVDLAYTVGGGSALYTKSPLQRCMRDVRAITQHAMVASHTHELFGRILLGVEPDSALL